MIQDIDKELHGMKYPTTGLQVWNPDGTSYFQADGADPYAYACGNSWSNATGDVADLQTKINNIDGAISNLLKESTAKSAEVVALDTQISSYTLKSKRDPLKAKQEALRVRVNSGIPNEIANLKRTQDELRKAQDKWRLDEATRVANDAAKALADAKTKDEVAQKAIDVKLAEKGINPETARIAAKASADAVRVAAEMKGKADALVAELKQKSSSRNKLIIIGGAILLVGVFGYMFFKRN